MAGPPSVLFEVCAVVLVEQLVVMPPAVLGVPVVVVDVWLLDVEFVRFGCKHW